MDYHSPLIQHQDALIELLASGLPQDKVLEKLSTDARFAPHQDYVKGFDPDMVP